MPAGMHLPCSHTTKTAVVAMSRFPRLYKAQSDTFMASLGRKTERSDTVPALQSLTLKSLFLQCGPPFAVSMLA